MDVCKNFDKSSMYLFHFQYTIQIYVFVIDSCINAKCFIGILYLYNYYLGIDNGYEWNVDFFRIIHDCVYC